MKKATFIEITIPCLTLLLGFLPNMLLSMYLNAFWLNSPVDFPFLAVPTIFFGDLVFLPIFNWLAYKSIVLSWEFIREKINLYVTLPASIVASSILSIYIHYAWLQDSYTGFMDVEQNKLSIAGWWHLSFTIIEMTVVILTVIFWFFALKYSKQERIHKAYLKAWVVFIAFTSINLPDMIFRFLFIETTRKNLTESILTQIPSFSTTIFALLILVIANVINQLSQKGKEHS